MSSSINKINLLLLLKMFCTTYKKNAVFSISSSTHSICSTVVLFRKKKIHISHNINLYVFEKYNYCNDDGCF